MLSIMQLGKILHTFVVCALATGVFGPSAAAPSSWGFFAWRASSLAALYAVPQAALLHLALLRFAVLVHRQQISMTGIMVRLNRTQALGCVGFEFGVTHLPTLVFKPFFYPLARCIPIQDRWVAAGLSSTGGGDGGSGGSEAGVRSQASLEMPPVSIDLGSLYRIDEGIVLSLLLLVLLHTLSL